MKVFNCCEGSKEAACFPIGEPTRDMCSDRFICKEHLAKKVLSENMMKMESMMEDMPEMDTMKMEMMEEMMMKGVTGL